MRALITGGGGQLASDLQTLLGDDAVALSHAELDIDDPASIDRAFDEHRPDVVFNCAAFHNVDQCEREPDQSWATNVRAVTRARRSATPSSSTCARTTSSTAAARSRTARTTCRHPRSVYALTKLAGEYAALGYAEDSLVVRSGGLYGFAGNASKGGNFVQRMIGRAREQGQLKMVADQRLQPTFTEDLAKALVEAVERDATGVLHLTNEGAMSWHDFTVAIMENAGIDVPIEAGTTTIAPGGVDRPLNGVLARPARRRARPAAAAPGRRGARRTTCPAPASARAPPPELRPRAARHEVGDGRLQRAVLGLEAVVARRPARPASGPGRRHPERVALALDDEHRDVDRVELVRAGSAAGFPGGWSGKARQRTPPRRSPRRCGTRRARPPSGRR